METKKTAFSVTFWARKDRSKGSEVPIYVRVTIDGKRMEQSTNQKILPEEWNGKKGMAKLIKEEYKALNSYLEQLRASFVECYRQMSIEKKLIDIESFKRR